MSKLIEERQKKYQELLADPDYTDVAFNPDTGGLKATHIGHSFDRLKGWYEKQVQEVGYNNGNEVIFGNELFGESGQRFTEGTWNGKQFEIAAAESGTSSNIIKALNHCASKVETKIAVIFFPNEGYNMEEFVRGIARYKGIKKNSPNNYVEFDTIIGITIQGEIKIPSKD